MSIRLLTLLFIFSFYTSQTFASDTFWKVSTSYAPECFKDGQTFTSDYLNGLTCSSGSTSYSNCIASSTGVRCRYNTNRGKTGSSVITHYLSKLINCPQGEVLSSKGICEPLCKSKEGQGLGTITFPVGTRDVSSICRNSCKANSSLFFPAANPPYGVFSYTGDSCDGSETSEGSGSGETGGGETGGGETGGGETGGGETGGGNGEVLSQISSKLDGLATGVTDIGDLLKDVDTSKAGIDGTCIQGGTCQGFYESAYEGDLSTVVGGQLDSMKTSIVDPFVSSFGNIDLSGAQRPKFGLPVPFYGYMSFDDYIDMDWIFGFLRFIFLASTAFYCRQIIFGG